MLIHMIVIIILVKLTFAKGNVGTTIFYNKHPKTDCWSDDDIVRLRARQAFEEIIPPQVRPGLIDAKYVKEVLRYFQKATYSINNIADPHKLTMLKESLTDTIGAHLRSEILPAVRFAYYAGYVPYRSARQLHEYFDDIKIYLNTQGLGWNRPRKASQNWSNLTVAKILIGAGTFFDPCSCLIMKRDSNSCIHLPIPKQDNNRKPSAVALPFKTGGLVSLSAPDSKNILLKYYTTASRCILSSSPEKCRHSDFVSFNNELWHWMKRDVAPHLMDEKLYAAYGGILRIAASVQNYGKGLSRRNLFDYQEAVNTPWHPWKSLTQPYLYINADWTPKIYVGLVILTAFTIYLIQICYTYILGDANGCQCKDETPSLFSKDTVYDQMDTNFRTMMPHQSAVYYSDKKRAKQSASRSKSASLGSIRTQKVYDLNENTEKLMAVIMSDKEDSLAESSASQGSEEEGGDNVIDVGHMMPIKSPPKIETSISQVTVDRTTRSRSQLPMYSTTTTRTLTDNFQRQNISDSMWSATDSSTSSRSGTSTTSKSRRSRSSRDLAWARRVISKHTLRSTTKSNSRSEVDLNSYTTPNSQT